MGARAGRFPGAGRGVRAALLGGGLLASGPLACRREDPEIRALTARAVQAEAASDQLRQAWAEQLRRFGQARIKGLEPGDEPLFLTPEQRSFLEARLREEVDSSRRALLGEILEKDRELRARGLALADLRAHLPAPELVRPGDSHYGLALRFLRRQGLSADQARQALAQVAIFERLMPGFEVYHFYAHGTYGTWVAQGTASLSPQAFALRDPELPEATREEAIARGRQLQRELARLEAKKREIEAELAEIRADQRDLLEGRAQLAETHAQQEARLNALHYLVGRREALEREGVIVIPFFGWSRSGTAWNDARFTQDLDLRKGTRLVLRAEDLGLPRIGKVHVVPGSHEEGAHYRLTYDPEGRTVTVDLLTPARFRNEKVAFAVED